MAGLFGYYRQGVTLIHLCIGLFAYQVKTFMPLLVKLLEKKYYTTQKLSHGKLLCSVKNILSGISLLFL